MTAVADAAEPPAPKRGINSFYSRVMRHMSLRHPGLWRLRIDLLALAGVIGLLCLVIGPKLTLDGWLDNTFSDYHMMGEYPVDPVTGQSDYSKEAPTLPADTVATTYARSGYADALGSAMALLFIGFGLFAIFWVYSILQPVRLRRVGRFQNKPSFTVLLLCLFWFLVWPALTIYLTDLLSYLVTYPGVDGPLRLAGGREEYPPIRSSFPVAVFTSAGVAAVLAVFVKTMLLSSLMRAIGAFFLAFAIFMGVGAIGYAVIGVPALVLPALDHGFYYGDLLSYFSAAVIAVPLGAVITLGAIWIVSLLVFRSRKGVFRRIALSLLTVIVAVCLFLAVVWLAAAVGRDGFMGGGGFAVLALIVLMFVCGAVAYLIPHIVAIGGDLRNGARSRLTRPVLLSCFWSAPTVIITGVMVLTSWFCNNVLRIQFPTQTYVLFGALGVSILISIVVVELFSRLTAHISSLPEP